MVDCHNKMTVQSPVVTLQDLRWVKSHGDGSDREQVISVPVTLYVIVLPRPHLKKKQAQPANRQLSNVGDVVCVTSRYVATRYNGKGSCSSVKTVVYTQCSFEPPWQTVIIAPDVDTLKLSMGDQNHQVHRQFGIQD